MRFRRRVAGFDHEVQSPDRLVGLAVRFTGVVYPGDTITTEMWDEGDGKIIVQSKTQEGRVVISNAAAEVKS